MISRSTLLHYIAMAQPIKLRLESAIVISFLPPFRRGYKPMHAALMTHHLGSTAQLPAAHVLTIAEGEELHVRAGRERASRNPERSYRSSEQPILRENKVRDESDNSE